MLCKVSRTQKTTTTKIMVEGIIHEIRILASQFELVVFKFSPRSCNKAANFVAACVVKENDVIQWDDFEPSWLFNILVTDVHVFIRIYYLWNLSGIWKEKKKKKKIEIKEMDSRWD